MGKGQARWYSPQEIGRALAVLDACGGNVSKAADLTGVPRQTIQTWLTKPKVLNDPRVVEIRDAQAKELGKTALTAATMIIPRMLELAMTSDKMRDVNGTFITLAKWGQALTDPAGAAALAGKGQTQVTTVVTPAATEKAPSEAELMQALQQRLGALGLIPRGSG